jgi:uncharacterized membrane protein YgdD (TMEM256/DUF423 family)
MQIQRQKTAPKQRLSVGEIVISLLNLIFSGAFSIMAYGFAFTNIAHTWKDYLAGGMAAAAALGSGMAALLIALRQRSLAAYSQWLSVLGVIAFSGLITVILLQNHHGDREAWKEILSYSPLLLFALLLAWFAWFLKRMDD